MMDSAAGLGAAGSIAVANPYVAVGVAALNAFGVAKQKPPDMGTALSGFSHSPFTIDNNSSGWVVNFKGIASSLGSRESADPLDAITGEAQTPLGSVPAWSILAGLAIIAIALKRRKC